MSRSLALALLLTACQAPTAVESYLAVVYLSPPNGTGNLPVDTEVTATFSEPLSEGSIDEESVYLVDPDSEFVPATRFYDEELWTIRLVPDEPLDEGTRYTFVLGTSLIGADSGPLPVEIRSSFSTASQAGTANTPPTADAGEDQQVAVGDVVQLDGSGSSDPDGDAITLLWEFVSLPDGSEAVLDDPTSETPTFVADAEGTYVVMLTASDGSSDSVPDYVQVEAVAAGR